MKIAPNIKIFTMCLISLTQINAASAAILASPDKTSDREKKNFQTTYGKNGNKQTTNSISNLPNNVVYFSNKNNKEDLSKLYGLAYNISLNSKIENFGTSETNSPNIVGEKIAKMLAYWPKNTVFLALLYDIKKEDVFPKLVITESQHLVVSYNDGTLDAINKISPIVAMFDITDDIPCEKNITQTDNYWIGVCKAISVANKIIRIESVGSRHDEPVIKATSK